MDHCVAFEADSGVSTGNTVVSWLFALHMAAVGGLPYRILVAILGLAIAALAASGVYLWWRKSRGGRKVEDSDQTG